MGTVKTIVCLANSRKPSGRCVAGREVVAHGAGSWIRPVSARPGEEVSERERQCDDGTDPQLLDVIDVPLLQHRPHACQTENWLLDPSKRWRRIRRADWNHLLNYIENPQALWINGSSTYHGAHDQIPQEAADRLPRSLHLIHVPRVDLTVFAPSAAFGNPNRRVQARFLHSRVEYALRVTDPLIERRFLAGRDGRYSLGECCLTISLSEPFETKGHSFRYKLVAAIIERGTGS